MSIVTIVGASGTAIQVTVTGGQAQELAEVYAGQMGNAFKQNELSTILLSEGSTSTNWSNGGVMEGFVTTGGSYSPLGTYDFLGVGSWGGKNGTVAPLEDRVTIDGSGVTTEGVLTVFGGGAAGLTYIAGESNGNFLATSGDNYFNGGEQSANWTIVTADGNDTILATNGTNNINAGTGKNLILLQQGTNNVVSEGQDTITGGSVGVNSVTLQGGHSVVSLGDRAYVSDKATVGSSITLGNNSSVEGGQSSKIIFAGANGTISNAQNDTVSAYGDLSVYYGSDQTVSVSGALKFIAGTGTTNIAAQQATLWGANDLSANIDVGDEAIFSGNQFGVDADQLIDASSSTGTLQAWTGAGRQTIIGSSGSDHFVFGTAYGGKIDPSYATVTGGDGAANTFGVLAGHTAGDVTITDFSATRGDTFFMYNYKPEDSAAEVQKLLATATIQGGNTSLMLDNDMRVTFLGVTDLQSSSITMS
ncbi:hypothetical protein [Asaia astilbis]|uniref:hypothetical protein n=1 Tax=Asaia astilbis TaxID=610244 RepID=UPI000472BE00|nr:hypothetical protein [Asaia astilbis]